MPKFKKEVSFHNAAEGLALVEGVEVVFEMRKDDDGKEKGLLARAKFKVVEHMVDPESNDAMVQDTFPLWTEFGFARFGGVLLAMLPKAFDADKDYPLGYFNDKKIQAKAEKSFGGMQFGTTIKHDKQLKQSAKPGSTDPGDYMIFAKLGDVYDKEEFKAKCAEAGKTAGGTAETPAETTTDEDWD